MTTRVTHASTTGAAANPNVLVDGPKWDADHAIAGNASDLDFVQSDATAVTRSVDDKLKDFLVAKDFGATGDGSTDDLAALQRAITAAVAGNKSLGVTHGTYAISNKLECGYAGLQIIALEGGVTIKRTGSAGTVVSFDGSASTGGETYNQVFGGPNVINIDGNDIGTIGLYVSECHNSSFRVNVRDVSTRPVSATTCVESDFEVTSSSNDAAFTTVAATGCLFDAQAGGRYKLILEGIGGSDYGATFTGGQACHVTGTVEGCLSGGIRLNGNTIGFTLYKVDAEVNHTAYDLNISGTAHTLIGCVTGLTDAGSGFASTATTLIGCQIAGAEFFVGALQNVLIANNFTTTPSLLGFVDGTPDSVRISNTNAIDRSPGASITGLTLYSGTAVPAGGTTGSGLKFSSTSNLGVFFGSGVPTLSAAQGSLYLRTDGSSTSTRLYVNTNGSTTWTNVTTAA